ncbi:MAG: succinate dehydrogenase assembly factor 2 [Thiotrichaceae bacterium]|nr:succinate dehydrogenase assembly factor 2 [Thiotrichaceae bacterium]
MKELEIWLNAYLNNDYTEATVAEQSAFSQLLDHEDDYLFDLLMSGLSVKSVISTQK